MVTSPVFNHVFGTNKENMTKPVNERTQSNIIKQREQIVVKDMEQLAMFDDSIMNADLNDNYEILGQIFDTYWIVAFHDKMYIVDQHAAHEKIKYEKFVKHLHESEILSQNLVPPVVISVDDKEKEVLLNYFDVFTKMGFEIEEFGGNDYALRAVPVDLYGCSAKELFLSVLDEMVEFPLIKDDTLVLDKIASMSCKAAVKGNTKLSYDEACALMKELLTLQNPFQCPHGRPTIISMSKYEIEKKFKRVL
jgi:DNA mismatch repair protein MutL